MIIETAVVPPRWKHDGWQRCLPGYQPLELSWRRSSSPGSLSPVVLTSRGQLRWDASTCMSQETKYWCSREWHLYNPKDSSAGKLAQRLCFRQYAPSPRGQFRPTVKESSAASCYTPSGPSATAGNPSRCRSSRRSNPGRGSRRTETMDLLGTAWSGGRTPFLSASWKMPVSFVSTRHSGRVAETHLGDLRLVLLVQQVEGRVPHERPRQPTQRPKPRRRQPQHHERIETEHLPAQHFHVLLADDRHAHKGGPDRRADGRCEVIVPTDFAQLEESVPVEMDRGGRVGVGRAAGGIGGGRSGGSHRGGSSYGDGCWCASRWPQGCRGRCARSSVIL